MNTDFKVLGLSPEPFRVMQAVSDEELADRYGARRVVVDAAPGFPCRVSLQDAAVGETVIAVSHTHHDVTSVYRASGPIFVREDAMLAEPPVNVLPAMLLARPQSLRAYDEHGEMVAADLCGGDLEGRIRGLLAHPGVAYLHLHNAEPGCFNCRVERADA